MPLFPYKRIGSIAGGRLDRETARLIAGVFQIVGDGEVIIEVNKIYDKRTVDQNKLYWKYMTLIAEEMALLKTDAHEKMLYFMALNFDQLRDPPYVDLPDGTTVLGAPKRTSKMNKQEFGLYLDNTISYATSEMGIILPPKHKIDAI